MFLEHFLPLETPRRRVEPALKWLSDTLPFIFDKWNLPSSWRQWKRYWQKRMDKFSENEESHSTEIRSGIEGRRLQKAVVARVDGQDITMPYMSIKSLLHRLWSISMLQKVR